MREHEFLTRREQAILMQLLVANFANHFGPNFLQNDEKMAKTQAIMQLYRQIGVAVTDIAKILSSTDD